jgi:hypothetical protein
MKKLLKHGALIAIALTIIAGCQKEEDVFQGTNLLQAVVVTADINGSGSDCTTLFAGQTIDVGDVCVSIQGAEGAEELCITYTTTGGWTMNEAHLWVGDDLADMPQSRKGNPKIGNFPYNSGDISGATTYTKCIPVSELTENICDATLYVAAHTAVQKDNGDGTVDSETAWGSGENLVERGSWATYSSVTFSCNDTEGPDPETGNCETAFAYGAAATCFLDIDEDEDGTSDFNRWGWTNFITESGTYTFDTYAGAGRCDITKGTLVGDLTVVYDEAAGTATVTFATSGGFTMDETHLYVGNDLLASNNGEFTVAPGQYPIVDGDVNSTSNTYVVEGLSGDIYVVAHSVVCGDY